MLCDKLYEFRYNQPDRLYTIDVINLVEFTQKCVREFRQFFGKKFGEFIVGWARILWCARKTTVLIELESILSFAHTVRRN